MVILPSGSPKSMTLKNQAIVTPENRRGTGRAEGPKASQARGFLGSLA